MDRSELWGWGGESTALSGIAEEYQGQRVFGNSEVCLKFLVNSGTSEQFLQDHPRPRERLSDYVRLESPGEITTAGNNKLKRGDIGIVGGCIVV